jgi:hypothetical protein
MDGEMAMKLPKVGVDTIYDNGGDRNVIDESIAQKARLF